MQPKWNHALAASALLLATAGAYAQNSDKSGTYVGFEAGAYFPIDTTIRNVFGSTIPRVGINFINNSSPNTLKPSVDFGIIGANKNGSRFLAIPVTLGIGRQYGAVASNMRPYWRVGAGAAYLDYSIDVNNNGNPVTAHKIGLTGIAEVGVLLTDRIRLSASYNYFSKQDDFNFTGYELKVSFLFWKV